MKPPTSIKEGAYQLSRMPIDIAQGMGGIAIRVLSPGELVSVPDKETSFQVINPRKRLSNLRARILHGVG